MLRSIAVFVFGLASTTIHAAPIAMQDFATFAGAGISPGGGDGRLDSNRFAISGFSDGDSAFGDTVLGGDFARGLTASPVRTGGLYAFALPGEAIGLGVQATGSDFAPGHITWRVNNSSSDTFDALTLGFEFWYRNNGARASELSVEWAKLSTPNRFTAVAAASRRTPASASTVDWQHFDVDVTLPGVELVANDAMLMRFHVADASGTGTRDEFAFTRLSLQGNVRGEADPRPLSAPPMAPLMLTGLFTAIVSRRRTRRWMA